MSQHASRLRDWISFFASGDRWEAPDRAFIGHRDILIQSRARYEFFARYVKGDLLDVGCGRGYGFEVVAGKTRSQVGLDLDIRFFQQARKLYPQPKLVCGKGDQIPFADDSFDSVIAFEVIEHAADGRIFLKELRRVARKNAVIAVSTPNVAISSAGSETPLNRFHHHEYELKEFQDLLERVFKRVQLFGQRERVQSVDFRNKVIDRIPIRWKYYLPHFFQALASVALRPPLRLDECEFTTEHLERAPTFLAVCHTS